MSPINNEANEYFHKQDKSDGHLCSVDKTLAEIAHVGALHHLGHESKCDDDHPQPSRLVVETFEGADALLFSVRIVVLVFDHLASEGTGFAFFADDLERRGNDGNQQGDEPQTQDEDSDDEENGADEVVGVGDCVEQVGPRVGRHDDEDELERLENVVEALCIVEGIRALDAE